MILEALRVKAHCLYESLLQSDRSGQSQSLISGSDSIAVNVW